MSSQWDQGNSKPPSDSKSEAKPEGYWRIPQLCPELGEEIIGKLSDFHSELLRFNKSISLIPKNSEREADILHIYDGVAGGRIVLRENQAKRIYDIGSGNGVPGIVMAIIAPERDFVLLEADRRKCDFLKAIVGKLGLKNVTVVLGKIEDLDEGSVECAVSRGFSSISKALLVSRKLFTVGAGYFHFKGSSWVREIAQIPSQICSFWIPRLVEEYQLPQMSSSMAVVLTKRTG